MRRIIQTKTLSQYGILRQLTKIQKEQKKKEQIRKLVQGGGRNQQETKRRDMMMMMMITRGYKRTPPQQQQQQTMSEKERNTLKEKLKELEETLGKEEEEEGNEKETIKSDGMKVAALTKFEMHQYETIVREAVENSNEEMAMTIKRMTLDHSRNMSYAMHALNMELNHIKHSASNPAAGMMRMQWWRDNVMNTVKNGVPPRVPVLVDIGLRLSRFQEDNDSALLRRFFRQLLKAKEMDLEWGSQPPTLDALEQYAEYTYGNMYRVTLSQLWLHYEKYEQQPFRPEEKQVMDHVASHLGKAMGLCLVLRGTRHFAQHYEETYLPADLCSEYGVAESDIYRGDNLEGIAHVVFRVANRAKAHFEEAQELAKSLPDNPDVRSQFYAAAFIDAFLSKLEKRQFDIFHRDLTPAGLRFSFASNLLKQYWRSNI